MDPVPFLAPTIEQDEWDADGFEIPSLNVGRSGPGRKETNGTSNTLKSASQKVSRGVEKIYLGPHGAPPSQMKQQEINGSGKKHRLKQKLKEVDKKEAFVLRENKVEVIRDLMGSKGGISTRGAPTEWLDPHCHEAQFERSV